MEFNSKINMLGILAPNDEPKLRGKESVFINSLQSLQYIVKRISHAPQEDSTELPDIFTGYLDSLKGYIASDDMSSLPEQRKDEFRKEFEQRVFVFRGFYDNYNNTFKMIKDADVQTRTSAFDKPGEQYVTIPTFQPANQTEQWEKEKRVDLKRTYTNFDEFLQRLKDRNYIGVVDGFQDPVSTPFVIWHDEKTDELLAIGFLDRCIEGASGYQFTYDYLGKIILTDEIRNGIIYPDKFNPTIIYSIDIKEKPPNSALI